MEEAKKLFVKNESSDKSQSFGYSDKKAVNGLEPIGIYGNGFKSGSMRLGKDAIVFSKSRNMLCVGMLSQTYLEKIGANQIIVPIVCFEVRNSDKFSVREEHKASLQDILRYSLFKTQEELFAELDAISSSSTVKTGTRIIIWNLRRTTTGTTEFDFEKDRYDIRIPSEIYETLNDPSQNSNKTISYIPESIYSLRAYCSILYLKPRMQVMVRGQKVKSQLIAKSLACIRKDHYKPTFLEKRVPITFGYNTKSKDQYGIMMYHKNRLIKAYERVGCQLKANNRGVGVIGVIECNFLDPTHNKQSFIESDKYRKTMNNLGIKLEEYWNEIRYRKSKENPTSTVPVEDTMKRPDQNWVQCDDCLKWRKLPDGIDVSKLPDKWFCRMNPDPQFRRCHVEEEPEDSDDDQPSYRKTYKQQERQNKRKQEKNMHLDQLTIVQHEEQRMASIRRETAALSRQHNNLKHLLHQKSPSSPTTPRGRSLQGATIKSEPSLPSSSATSQAGCSPSTASGLPVITNVCSLSGEPQRGKRTQLVTSEIMPKRPRINGFQEHTAGDVSSTVHSERVDDDVTDDTDDTDDDDGNGTDLTYDTDDDIVILETESTPKPNKPSSRLTKIKHEKRESPITMLLECSDDVAVDVSSERNAAGTSAAVETSRPLEVANSTTQTVAAEVKEEHHSQNHNEEGEKVCSTCGTDQSPGTNHHPVQQRELKQDKEDDGQYGNQEKHKLHNGVAHMKSDETPGPSALPQFISVAQKQQDQLLELMQDTAQERYSLKQEVQKLNVQLQKQSHISVKKERSHQACQTEGTGDQKDYKSLFEKAKQKVNDLIKDKEALLLASEAKTNLVTEQDEERDIDEISLQVGCLVHELDQTKKERDELRSQLDSLEEEKSNLAAQCEELKLRLQQQRENAQASQRGGKLSAQSLSVEAGESTTSGTNSDASRSLIELRQNVGRLLVTFVPALDLEQVNYECNVIDEILEQVLNEADTR
ncbi:MORC family CW-type zinc finger protein 3a [Nematolebias whitei]|uniref:MORC family CW-type zinc finger protein 3a n=1 Tax=Nematolebias whitei TaxID=451745 RepID=UPI001899A85F|nr:MORC family CW-type zinc finger protein 3a [Nematolebias whitei]